MSCPLPAVHDDPNWSIWAAAMRIRNPTARSEKHSMVKLAHWYSRCYLENSWEKRVSGYHDITHFLLCGSNQSYFFFHPKDWNDSPITSCSGSTTQSFIASACPSVRCVAWGRSHDDENWSIRDLRWEEKTLPQGLRADAFMTWCLTQCVVSLKWPMAGPVPFTVTFPCHGFCPTPRLEMRLYTKGLRGGNGPRT